MERPSPIFRRYCRLALFVDVPVDGAIRRGDVTTGQHRIEKFSGEPIQEPVAAIRTRLGMEPATTRPVLNGSQEFQRIRMVSLSGNSSR